MEEGKPDYSTFRMMVQNRRKRIEWTSNVVLFIIVVISWAYTIYAGRYGSILASNYKETKAT